MEDELSIPDFLRVENRTGVVPDHVACITAYVDPVTQRQNELRAAHAAADKAKREQALARHLRKIEDEHPGEEWDRKAKMWKRTDRAMAKYEARLQAEFEQSGKEG